MATLSMATLSSQAIDVATHVDLLKSYGPFCWLEQHGYYFDTTVYSTRLWLGYWASPMCGTWQLTSSQADQGNHEQQCIHQAFVRLLERSRHRLPPKLSIFTTPSNLIVNPESRYPVRQNNLVYNYIALSVIDQYHDTFNQIADSIRHTILRLVNEHDHIIAGCNLNADNLQFSLNFHTESNCKTIRNALPLAGIYNASPTVNPRQISFHLNLAFRGPWLQLFWDQLSLAIKKTTSAPSDSPPRKIEARSNESLLEFHQAFNTAKRTGQMPRGYDPIEMLERQLKSRNPAMAVHQITPQNYPQFRQKILDMQTRVYEPTRQSPPEEFDQLFRIDRPLGIVASLSEQIVGMVFAGPISLFQDQSGVQSDPFANDPSVYYSMDLTIAEPFRGGQTGRLLKQASAMLAIKNGVSAIHGRNRDQLAAGMWAINLSLGSYELQHLKDDYRDDHQHRDCIYYRCPLQLKSDEANRAPGFSLDLSIIHGR